MSTHELDEVFGTRTPKAQLEADTSALGFQFLSVVDRLMESRGISKRSLAAMIGTSPAFVTQLFRGHKVVNLETLAKMQTALGIEFSVAMHVKYQQSEENNDFQAAEQ